LIDLYYSPHAIEALVICFCNPRVRVAAYSLAKEVLPVIQSRLSGERAGLDSGTRAHADQLIALFAREASPELKKVIASLRESFMQGSLIEKLGFSREK
jgi:hypothetical protein